MIKILKHILICTRINLAEALFQTLVQLKCYQGLLGSEQLWEETSPECLGEEQGWQLQERELLL